MKIRLMAPVLIVLLALSVQAIAEDVGLPRISVIGTAEKMVKPDRIVWALSVQNKGVSLDAVAREHSVMVGDLIAYLKKAGVEARHIQSSRMQFGENWTYKNNTRVKEGYVADTYVTFKLNNIDRYNALWMGLAELRGVSVRNAYYTIADKAPHEDEVRNEALLAARRKAGSMAKALGVNLGEPLIIDDENSPSEPVHPPREALAARAAFDQRGNPEEIETAPGQIPIRIRVRVVFRLISPGG